MSEELLQKRNSLKKFKTIAELLDTEKKKKERKAREKREESLLNIENLIENRIFISIFELEDLKLKLEDILNKAKEYDSNKISEKANKLLDSVLKKQGQHEENIKKILQFEYENQEEITRSQIVKDLGYDVDESKHYFDLINSPSNLSFDKIPDINSISVDIINKLTEPCLYGLVNELGYEIETAKSIGNYLINDGWIKKFPRFPKRKAKKKSLISKSKKDVDKTVIEKLKKIIQVSNKIRFKMIKSMLGIDDETFYNKILDWAVEFGFTINGDFLIINKDTVNDFIKALDQQFEVWAHKELDKSDKI